MTEQKFSDRMNGRSKFTLDEVEAMARVLGFGPGVWFDEPEAVMSYLEAAKRGGADPKTGNRWIQSPLGRLRDAVSLDLTTAEIPQMRVS